MINIREVKNQRQRKGLLAEQRICELYTQFKLSDNHFSLFDAIDTNTGLQVSIKTTKDNNEICLGDFINQSHINNDFIMVLCICDEFKENITKIYNIRISAENWNKYFGKMPSLLFEKMRKIKRKIKVFKDIEDELVNKAIQELLNIYDNKNAIIKLRPRRYKKTQLRFQCTFTLKSFLETILLENEIIEIRG